VWPTPYSYSLASNTQTDDAKGIRSDIDSKSITDFLYSCACISPRDCHSQVTYRICADAPYRFPTPA
jgi:hypothetical protein